MLVSLQLDLAFQLQFRETSGHGDYFGGGDDDGVSYVLPRFRIDRICDNTGCNDTVSNSRIEVEGIDLDGILEEKGATWLVEQSERFYVSLGFPELPESFYTKSSLYPLPDSVDYKKNNHASAWHLDLQNDVRSLMSVIPNSRWYETTHHELGHVYYFLEYTNPNVPPLLSSQWARSA